MGEPTKRILAKLDRDGEARFASCFLMNFLRDLDADPDRRCKLEIVVENGMAVIRKG